MRVTLFPMGPSRNRPPPSSPTVRRRADPAYR